MPSESRAGEPVIWRFDRVAVDARGFRVSVDGMPRPLEPKAFRLLQFLIEHRDRAVTKAEIFDAVWQGVAVTDNALTRAVAQIRKAIDDDPRQPRYIETVPSVGYRFVGRVHAADAPAEDPPPLTPAPAVPRRRPIAALLAVAVVLAAVAIAGIVLRERGLDAPAPVPDPLVPVQFSASSGLDMGPAFSSDGRLIAYATDESGGFEIVVKSFDPAARTLHLTSDGGQNLYPAFSPDGQWIAFWSAMRGGIFRVPAIGGAVQRLTDFGTQPVYSPDGRWIAFRSAAAASMSTTDYYWPPVDSTVWLVPADGGTPMELTDRGAPLPGGQAFPSFSPDSSEVRFVAAADGEFSVWSFRLADRHAVKRFASRRWTFSNAIFSRDDRRLWFVDWKLNGTIGIRELPVDPRTLTPTGEPAVVFPPSFAAPRDLALSPDGRRLAFTAAQSMSRIVVQPIGAPVSGAEAVSRDAFRNALVRTSPDGSRLVYTTFPRNGVPRLWMGLADGSAPRVVGGPPDGVQNFGAFTADNAAVLFSEIRGDQHRLWRERLADGARDMLALLPGGANQVGWSADGTRVVFHNDKELRRRLYAEDVRTGAAHVIAEGTEDYGFGRFSRDDRWISFEITHRPRGGNDIAVVPAAGGPVEIVLHTTEPTFSAGWMGDNDRILFAGFRNGAWNIYTVSRTSHAVEQLTSYSALRTYVRYPDWLTGERLVYEFNETRGNVFVADLRPPER